MFAGCSFRGVNREPGDNLVRVLDIGRDDVCPLDQQTFGDRASESSGSASHDGGASGDLIVRHAFLLWLDTCWLSSD